MKRCHNLLLLVLFCLSSVALAAPSKRRVLIISVDGLRPDLVLRGENPTLRRLMNDGAYTSWAQTTAVSVTVPSHVSMLTGVKPQTHKIEWNHDLPLASPVYPAVPTLFEVAKNAGYSTGLIAGKSKFDVLQKPGTLDVTWAPTEPVITDREVLAKTLSVINAGPPQVLVVHLPETDRVGHAIGWGTPQEMAAFKGADSAIGLMLGMLDTKGLLDDTLVIISADHGGAGRTHGAEDVRSRCIPWIAAGPGVRRGVDLTSVAPDRVVRTEDTFATACQFLGLPIDPKIDGRPVIEAFDRRGEELLTDATETKADVPAAPLTTTTRPATTQPDAALTVGQ